MEIQTTTTIWLILLSLAIISQYDLKDTPNRYNLRSRAQSIAKSVIEPHPMPTLKLNTPNKKLNHRYASAAQAHQIRGLLSKIQANPESWLTNATIDIDENTNPYFSGSIIDDDTGKSLEFCELIKMDKYHTVWMKNFSDEIGRLVKDIWDIPGTNTICFICRSPVPKVRTVTYDRIVVSYRPQKKDPNRTRLTVCGDHLHCIWVVRTATSDLSTSNILFNSFISAPGTIFITMEIKNFYLGTPMKLP